jgi:hypothetical protein
MSRKKPLSFGLLASNLCRAFRTLQFEYRTASGRILVNIDRDIGYGVNFARTVLQYWPTGQVDLEGAVQAYAL